MQNNGWYTLHNTLFKLLYAMSYNENEFVIYIILVDLPNLWLILIEGTNGWANFFNNVELF